MKLVGDKNVYSVTEVNSLARKTLEQIQFWVEGELSSFDGYNPRYRYLYFDLKDPQTGFKLPCILDPEVYLSLNQQFTDGMKVLALGTLTLWEKEAKFQMRIFKMQDFGEGMLLAQFEKLKKKLQNQGFFDTENKKDLPKYPVKIAVITSKVSDAWQDFKKHSRERFHSINLTLYDVLVQGERSASQVIKALKKADTKKFDLICIIRGGGSSEDLASYNDEKLADAIFRAKTPIVAGIGHEKDVTIASLIADVSASTPTDAAKIITEDFLRLEEKLNELILRTKNAVRNLIYGMSQQLDLNYQKLLSSRGIHVALPDKLIYLYKSLKIYNDNLFKKKYERLQYLKTTLLKNSKAQVSSHKILLNNYSHKLSLISPENILNRGYSITTNLKGQVIKDSSIVAIGEKLNVKLAKGKLESRVFSKEV